MKAMYSGDESKKFWDDVNSIKNESDHQEIYSLGVALQNFEYYVLKRFKDVTHKPNKANGKTENKP